jgi:hypothetical protein
MAINNEYTRGMRNDFATTKIKETNTNVSND